MIRKNKPLIIFLVISTVLVFFTVLVGMVLVPEAIRIGPSRIKAIDVGGIPEGTYYGSAETFMASAEVSVKVNDGRIKEIDLLDHVHSNGEKAEAVLERVLDEQSLQVDVVSGATTSSLILLKAVEDALSGVSAEN